MVIAVLTTDPEVNSASYIVINSLHWQRKSSSGWTLRFRLRTSLPRALLLQSSQWAVNPEVLNTFKPFPTYMKWEDSIGTSTDSSWNVILCGVGFVLLWSKATWGLKYITNPAFQHPLGFQCRNIIQGTQGYNEQTPHDSYQPRDLDRTDLSSDMPWVYSYSINGLCLPVFLPITVLTVWVC